MKQLVAWIFIVIGVLWLLPLLKLDFLVGIDGWLVAIGFLLVGVIKLTSK